MNLTHFNLILHSHIPFVLDKGKAPFGEEWLFEAVAESYIPLLNILNKLKDKNISPKIAISFSPILLDQLAHHTFDAKFNNYCYDKIQFAHLDKLKFIAEKNIIKSKLAEKWELFYHKTIQDYKIKYNNSIINEFKKLQDEGHIEIIITAATHSFLPLINDDDNIEAQIMTSKKAYLNYFNSIPKGFWLPECGYRDGIDTLLTKHGFEYIISDENVIPKSEILEDIDKSIINNYSKNLYVLNSGIKLIVRNNDLAMQVWSSDIGYPGDKNYLDFHTKQENSFLRYSKITGKDVEFSDKNLYDNSWQEILENHVYHFSNHIISIADNTDNDDNGNSIICLPFDTELFGHWWFEGCEFLYRLLITLDDNQIKISTCKNIINIKESKPIKIKLANSSWGLGNDFRIWKNKDTEYYLNLFLIAEIKLNELREISKENIDLKNKSKFEKLVKYASKELSLLMASDWLFMITNKIAEDYAKKRIMEHYNRFNSIYELKYSEDLSAELNKYPELDNLFEYAEIMN